MNANVSRVHTAVLIGRFQPFHNGHLALFEQALQRAQQVVVVLGSAHQARSAKNPWIWEERREMIFASLPHTARGRVHFVPIRDFYNLDQWVEEVSKWVHALAPMGASIGLVGHDKDASSAYLRHFPEWNLIELERQNEVDAVQVRDLYWEHGGGTESTELSTMLPAPVLAWLQQWSASPAYEAVRQEARDLAAYRQSWADAPFAPVFVTVDAMLVCNEHVLLVQRGRNPGAGLLALPGGFLEPHESLEDSARRELREETGLDLADEVWRSALQGVEVFDHPQRSQRGRTITHVYVLHLPDEALPEIESGDDAQDADWVHVNELWKLEPQFFEDHFHILRRCFERFGRSPEPPL